MSSLGGGVELRSFADDLADLAVDLADRPACVVGSEHDRTVTYAELGRLVDRAVAWLDDRGVAAGDAVVALLPSSLDAVVTFFACLRSGRSYVPLPCTATPPEVAAVVAMTRPRLVVVADQVPAATSDAPCDVMIERVATGSGMPWLPIGGSGDADPGGRLIVTTSGSTGSAKAVVIDGDRLWSSAHAFLAHHQLSGSGLRFWNHLPMSYLGGLFNLALIPLAAGGSFVVDEPFSGRTFLGYWQQVARHGIDALWLVPSILRGLVALGERRGPVENGGVRACFLGTAPVTGDEKDRFAELFGVRPLENYGLSETTFLTTEHSGSGAGPGVGRVLPWVELDLRPAPEAPVASPLEIAVRTPFQMLGYLGADGLLDPATDEDGFFRTGDLGRLEGDELVLVGRARDVVKKGGHLIVLSEPEEAAGSHPGVVEAVAVPVAHDFYGESYVLVAEAGPTVDAAEIEATVRGRLARHKLPERIVVLAELPRTRSGKVRRGELADAIDLRGVSA